MAEDIEQHVESERDSATCGFLVLMIIGSLLARPVIVVLLGEKFLEAIPLFSKYQNERNLVSDTAHRRIKVEAARIWETLTR